jgi:hypothetical protein
VLTAASLRAACERLMIHLTEREASVLVDTFGTKNGRDDGTVDHVQVRFAATGFPSLGYRGIMRG